MGLMEIFEKILMTTYTICLPIFLARISEAKKDRKKGQAEVMASVQAVNESLEKLSERVDYNEAMTSRYRIIRAADELRNGAELSHDSVENLMEDMDTYTSYVDRHPSYKNHKGQASMRLILEYNQRKGETK